VGGLDLTVAVVKRTRKEKPKNGSRVVIPTFLDGRSFTKYGQKVESKDSALLRNWCSRWRNMGPSTKNGDLKGHHRNAVKRGDKRVIN